MEQNRHDRDFEIRHLEQVLTVAREQLDAVLLANEENKEAIIAAKIDMWEDTSRSISGLWQMENFHELVELSQYANSVSERVSDYERDNAKILTLKRLLDSPYFARIDMKFEEEDAFEPVYIGRSSLQKDLTREMMIYDWRSPIASVFYRFGPGKVSYASPGGEITGEVNLKRQYEIKNGTLAYYFDADVHIIDEFLRRLLSQNASATMKTIVETIQKDQDLIIRDLEMDVLMVQGSAGSGKTSVALHRAAYLMYRGLAAKLTANEIVIISPNSLFEQYIVNVLPELGEKNIRSLVFEDIFSNVLQRESIQSRNHYWEVLLSSGVYDETPGHSNGSIVGQYNGSIVQRSMAFKSSGLFAEILRRFIKDLPLRWLPFADIYYDGKVIASKQWLKAKILKSNHEFLLGVRLKQLEESLWQRIHELRPSRLAKLKNFISAKPIHEFEVNEVARRISILESSALRKKIRQFTELDALELYRKLFADNDYFYQLAKGLTLPDGIAEIIAYTRENLQKEALLYDDALALTFLHLNTKGYSGYLDIKQVVVDEAQDYDPLHFEILHALFPRARYTILGDTHQTIGKREDAALYDEISRIFAKPKSMRVILDKSFRSTREIVAYSARFLDQDVLSECFGRSGDTPAVLAAPDQAALAALLLAEIATCREKGYQSIGLICKTEHDALSWYEQLKDQSEMTLLKGDVPFALSGVFLIPVYLAKGLEFDAVLVCDVDHAHYHRADDRHLLYIACTRALHRLNLFYTGEMSPLL
ncbi:ATP-binding domain-containing protein [Dehalobacter sp. DCM]|uniref:HelD family protein n=1 Tax=Dehalobacter sp. DCM TaxID=2907827 RepID=UPI003081AAE4|nr:ATP-binding domain-containing protein [Dehalobacter sp. DCM]